MILTVCVCLVPGGMEHKEWDGMAGWLVGLMADIGYIQPASQPSMDTEVK